jgi:predicted transcriptional regulator
MEQKDIMKRSRHIIISQILKICIGGANKTKIVYQANLNFKTVKPYTDLLINNGLLNIRQGPTIIYETTEKGIELIEKFNKINSELSER